MTEEEKNRQEEIIIFQENVACICLKTIIIFEISFSRDRTLFYFTNVFCCFSPSLMANVQSYIFFYIFAISFA